MKSNETLHLHIKIFFNFDNRRFESHKKMQEDSL